MRFFCLSLECLREAQGVVKASGCAIPSGDGRSSNSSCVLELQTVMLPNRAQSKVCFYVLEEWFTFTFNLQEGLHITHYFVRWALDSIIGESDDQMTSTKQNVTDGVQQYLCGTNSIIADTCLATIHFDSDYNHCTLLIELIISTYSNGFKVSRI